jgi:PAS domain-containing protein
MTSDGVFPAPLPLPGNGVNAAQDLMLRLRHLETALNASAIVAITDRHGKINYVNDKFCEISKYPRSELIGNDHRIVNSNYHPRRLFY